MSSEKTKFNYMGNIFFNKFERKEFLRTSAYMWQNEPNYKLLGH